MAKKGRYQQVKKKSWGKRIMLSLVVVFLVLVLGTAAAGAIYYNSMLNLVTRPEATEQVLSDAQLEEILGFVPEKVQVQDQQIADAETEPAQKKEDHIVNIMLIGQQARKNETAKLSDTMILCSINKETKTITLTSFLRDLYVQLPDFQGHVCGKNRINVAYNLGWYWAGEKGGMEMLDQLILENFGVEVDYNVEVGFDTFIKVIDVMGGVDVQMDADVAKYIKVGEEAGTYHLDGEKALGYARTRHVNAGDNDFNRTSRQRNLITSLLNKAKTMKIADLHNMLKEILPLVITDMTNEEITACALELLPMIVDLDIKSNQVPAPDTYYMTMLDIIGVESSVIICDEEANKELLMAIAEPPVG